MNTRNAAVLEKPRARIRVLRETFARLALHPDFFICVAFLRLPCEAPIAFCLSLCGPVPAAFPDRLVDCLSVMDKSRAESFQPPCNPSWFIERFIRRRQVECNPDIGLQVEFLTLVADESASGRCNSETLEMCVWFHAVECRDGLQNGFASQFFNFFTPLRQSAARAFSLQLMQRPAIIRLNPRRLRTRPSGKRSFA